jgi:hypothetical protein
MNGVTMTRTLGLVAVSFVLVSGSCVLAADESKAKELSTLEGQLRVEAKNVFLYYLATNAGQRCALYGADHQRDPDLLAKFEPGTPIRVRGTLNTFHHSDEADKNPSPFLPGWVIYMDVSHVEAIDVKQMNRAEGKKDWVFSPPRQFALEHRPTGTLRFPLGTYLKIEGAKQVARGKAEGRTLLIDTVEGKQLDKPVKLPIKNVEIPDGRCVLNGYETGAWVGTPEGLPPGTPAEPFSFHFHPSFIVTSVDAPKGLKVEQ